MDVATTSASRELAETIASQCNYTGTIKWDTSKADGTPRKLLDVSRIQELGLVAEHQLGGGDCQGAR